MSTSTQSAVILAAGWGSRIQSLGGGKEKISKPLIALGDEPMISRVIRTLAAAGIGHFVVVTGFLAEKVEAEAKAVARKLGVDVSVVFNPRWHDLANGVSALAAKDEFDGPFLLSMSDHAYDVSVAKQILAEGLDGMGVKLAIDRKLDTIFDMDDATKVKTDGRKIVDIGKNIADFNAVDIGLFHCSPEVFEALESAYLAKGDCSLSDGMKRMGSEGRFGFVDIGAALWQDVDTPECLAYAETLLKAGTLHFPE